MGGQGWKQRNVLVLPPIKDEPRGAGLIQSEAVVLAARRRAVASGRDHDRSPEPIRGRRGRSCDRGKHGLSGKPGLKPGP
jgi:hypothetical protein